MNAVVAISTPAALKSHPIADIFPAMTDAEFAALKADIRSHGQLESIATFEGMILDGRHRARACAELGVEPFCTEYSGKDPLGFVVSLNLHRRHLDESQRAMVAAKLANMPQGHRTDAKPSANLHKVSQAEAASLLNVSTRTVAAASKVRRTGAPELVSAVESGKVSVSAAAKVSELPKDDQAKVAAAEPKKIQDVARKLIEKHGAPVKRKYHRKIHNRRIVETSVDQIIAQADVLDTFPFSTDGFAPSEAKEWANALASAILRFRRLEECLKKYAASDDLDKVAREMEFVVNKALKKPASA